MTLGWLQLAWIKLRWQASLPSLQQSRQPYQVPVTVTMPPVTTTAPSAATNNPKKAPPISLHIACIHY